MAGTALLSSWRDTRLGQRLFCTALAMLLVLSEVFSSNIQATLPAFSHLCRVLLTGGAAALLLFKCVFLTRYDNRAQYAILAVALGYSGFAAAYGEDVWFFLIVLLGAAAKGVDLRAALKVYLITAAVGVAAVQLLHGFTGLVPFNWNARNWDYGYGHYNGYGARLLGVFMAWAWLSAGTGCAGLTGPGWPRWARIRCWGRAAAGRGLPCFCCWRCSLRSGCCPAVFTSKAWLAFVVALYPLLTAASLLTGYLFDPNVPERTPLLAPGQPRFCPAGLRCGIMCSGPRPTPTPEEGRHRGLVPRGYAVHLQLAGRHVYRRRCAPRPLTTCIWRWS